MTFRGWGILRVFCIGVLFSALFVMESGGSQADVETSTSLYARVEENGVPVLSSVNKKSEASAVLERGQVCRVLTAPINGWMKIRTEYGDGYVESRKVSLFEVNEDKIDPSLLARKRVVNYALQFVGGTYVYGGNDPHTGVDCSGFTRYVLRRTAGVELYRTSASQSLQGRSVSRRELRPGDLVFYAANGAVNHVAIYMGDGKIVHASSAKTGIKISSIDHRPPAKYKNVIN